MTSTPVWDSIMWQTQDWAPDRAELNSWVSNFQSWPLTSVLDALLMLVFPACFLCQEYIQILSIGKHLRHFFSWKWTSTPGAAMAWQGCAVLGSQWASSGTKSSMVVWAWHSACDNESWHRFEWMWYNAFLNLSKIVLLMMPVYVCSL